jgi:hypothetical protein
MRRFALCCALALVLAFAVPAFAKGSHPANPAAAKPSKTLVAANTQTVDILISKLSKNFALKTNWGDIYFSNRDLHRLIHGAAHLRPVVLGDFATDTGSHVAVKTLGYDKGVVTLSMTSK